MPKNKRSESRNALTGIETEPPKLVILNLGRRLNQEMP